MVDDFSVACGEEVNNGKFNNYFLANVPFSFPKCNQRLYLGTLSFSEFHHDFENLDLAMPLTVNLSHDVWDLSSRHCLCFEKNPFDMYFILPTKHIYTFI